MLAAHVRERPLGGGDIAPAAVAVDADLKHLPLESRGQLEVIAGCGRNEHVDVTGVNSACSI
jgi:hypothetical protein